MNTPAHLLIGAASFGRGQRPLIWAALAGALLPDASLYLLASGAILAFGISPEVVFNELYYSDLWQSIFSVDNSFLVWGLLLGLALWQRSSWAIALTGAALVHLALDFPLHHDDGRAHFWPVSGWKFESPVSYWDVRHGAHWVGPIEAALSVIAAIRLWLWRPGWVIASLTGVLLLAELMTARVWLFVFSA